MARSTRLVFRQDEGPGLSCNLSWFELELGRDLERVVAEVRTGWACSPRSTELPQAHGMRDEEPFFNRGQHDLFYALDRTRSLVTKGKNCTA